MKKSGQTENKIKGNSPTKRKWTSKALEILSRTLDKYTEDTTDAIKELNSTELPNHSEVSDLLAKAESLVEEADVRQLLEEAELLAIPAFNESFKEIKNLVAKIDELERDSEKVNDKTQPRMAKYILWVKRAVNIGVNSTSLNPIKSQLLRNQKVLAGIQQQSSLTNLKSIAEEIEQNAKFYDPELLVELNKKKDKIKKVMAKAENVLKFPQFCLIDEKSLRVVAQEIHENGFDFEIGAKIKAITALISKIRSLHKYLSRRKSSRFHHNMGPDDNFNQEDLSDTLQTSTFILKDLLEAKLDVQTIEILSDAAQIVKAEIKVLGLDDSELNNFLSKLESVVWRYNATLVLDKNDDNEEELTRLLQATPQDIQVSGCREYSQIKERVHAIQTTHSNEKRIVDRLDQYWEDEQLDKKVAEVKNFVEETKNFILKKKIERKLEILEMVAVALNNILAAKNLEDLVDEMSDLKLNSTKVFLKLSNFSKSLEKAKKQRSWLQLNKKKLQKYRETVNTPSIRQIVEMPKMKLSQARETYNFLKGLPDIFKKDYVEEISSLEDEIHGITALSQELDLQIKQHPRLKFMDMKYNVSEVKTCLEKVKSISRKYYDTNYKDEGIEAKLQELDLLIRSACLLERSIDPSMKRDISSWEGILRALKEWNKDDKNNNLLKAIVNKMKRAEKILMEVHRMRQFESQMAQTASKNFNLKSLTRQDRMPTLEEAKKLLASYEGECQEIELEDTSSYLKQLIEGTEEKIENIMASNALSADLVSIQEQLKRTPLNLDQVLVELNDRILKAQEFLRKIKGVTAEGMSHQIQGLREDYELLGVKIPEFEKINEQFKSESRKNNEIEVRFNSLSLQEVMQLRKDILNNLFHKDKNIEAKLLFRQVQLLEEEFNKITEGYDDGKDDPMFDLISLESLLKELQEVRKNSKLNVANKGQFLNKLISDIRVYLQEQIYSLDLNTLLKLKSNCFKKFVDLTKEITDHKIKLELALKPVEKAKKPEVEETKKYDAFGLFGTEFALVSRMDPPAKPVEEAKPYKPTMEMDVEDLTRKKEETKRPEYDRGDGDRRRTFAKRTDPNYTDPKKPDISSGNITSQLRQYYVACIKQYLERNDNFEISGLDVLMASNALERQIFDKHPDKLKPYDETCSSIVGVLANLLRMKNLSQHIRNKGFRLSILMKLTGKEKDEFKRIDAFAKQKLDKIKNAGAKEAKEVDGEEEIADKPEEEAAIEEDLNFSDYEDEGADDDKVEEIQTGPSRRARALAYDPETGQYKTIKGKYLEEPKVAEYTYFKIFKGGISYETSEKPETKKKPDRTSLFSCTGDEFIRYFTEVPNDLQLSPQLTRFEFEQYIQKVLISDQAFNYLVLPFWVESSTPLTIKNFYRSNECVGSTQYSQRCKIFIFPKEYIRGEWLNVLNFFLIRKDPVPIELVGFIVLKLVPSDSYEVPIIPDPMDVEKAHKAFKLTKIQNDIVEKIMDIENLKENKETEDLNSPAKDQNRYFQDVVEDFTKEDDKSGKPKKVVKSKLERLMDNDLGTTVQPKRVAAAVKERPAPQEEQDRREKTFIPDTPAMFRAPVEYQPKRAPSGLTGMVPAHQNQMNDMMSDEENRSRGGSFEDMEDQGLGKRGVNQRGPGQSNSASLYNPGFPANPHIPPHKSFVKAPSNQAGSKPGQFGESNVMSSHGGNQSQLGAPLKILKTLGMPERADRPGLVQSNPISQPRRVSGPQGGFEGNQMGDNMGRPERSNNPSHPGGGMNSYGNPPRGNSYQGNFGNNPGNSQGGYGSQNPPQNSNQGAGGYRGASRGRGGNSRGSSRGFDGGQKSFGAPSGGHMGAGNSFGNRGARGGTGGYQGGSGGNYQGGSGGSFRGSRGGSQAGGSFGGGGFGGGAGGYQAKPTRGAEHRGGYQAGNE
jgi:hypothetical protein